MSCLLELHRLISEGRGDSSEADDIRDQMEPYWRKLTDKECADLDRLSEDLYSQSANTD